MNLLSKVTLITTMTLALGATIALAGPGAKRPGIMQMADELELSEEQRTAIEGIVSESRSEGMALRQEGRSLKLAMKNAIESNADDATVANLAREMYAIRAQGREIRLGARSEIKEILTEEQLSALKARRVERREARQQR